MPTWLFWSITLGAFISAFRCEPCQRLNAPHLSATLIIDAKPFRIAKSDSFSVMLIPEAHDYYALVYAKIAQCSHLRDDAFYANMDFYVTDKVTWWMEGDQVDAFYNEPTQSVVLGLASVWDDKIVGHEILHALLNNAGIYSREHPTFWFNVMCGDYVTSPWIRGPDSTFIRDTATTARKVSRIREQSSR